MKINKPYLSFISELKQSIIRSRYQAASLANREQLMLYLYVGKKLSEKIKIEKWGAKVLQQIAEDLQKELPGLRGFSDRNLNKMKQFFEAYYSFLIMPSATAQLTKSLDTKGKRPIMPSATAQIGQSVTAQLKKNKKPLPLKEEQLNAFFNISFTHHILLLNKCKDSQERFFYIQSAASEMWSIAILQHQIASKLYKKQGKLPNNFKTALPEHIRATALNVFKDNYFFDFVTLEEFENERGLEDKIVANIRKFIMTVGKGFSFIGNQYRMEVDGEEFFVDLLFYNRILQCLVAFELKKEKFKPEHAGKLNFYLNVLDDKVKLPNENPSIGIILCKEKNNSIVEYAFKSINKAMGVATYKLSTEVPKKLKGILPDAEAFKKLL